MTEKSTYIEPGYRRTSSGHKLIDGVQFFSYSTGISRYARISEDGQICTSDNGPYRNSYRSAVVGHGTVGQRYRTETAAARAAIKVWRKLQESKK